MRIKYISYYILVIISINGCRHHHSNDSMVRLTLIDSFSIEKHEIHMLPVIHGNNSFYVNKDKVEVIIQKEKLNDCIVLNYSNSLRNILNLGVFNDSLLIINGIPNLIIYNLKTKTSEVNPKYMDMASNMIINDSNILLAGINMVIDTPFFTLNSIELGDTLIQKSLVKIEPQMEVENFLLTGYLLETTDNIIFIYDWLGEYLILDKHMNKIKKTGNLPLLGNHELFEAQVDITPPYYQAYSADVYRDSLIFVLREVDFETVDEDIPDERIIHSSLRKRVHVFNENMSLISSFQLQRKATQIKVINDSLLYTLHHRDNKIYIYEINY